MIRMHISRKCLLPMKKSPPSSCLTNIPISCAHWVGERQQYTPFHESGFVILSWLVWSEYHDSGSTIAASSFEVDMFWRDVNAFEECEPIPEKKGCHFSPSSLVGFERRTYLPTGYPTTKNTFLNALRGSHSSSGVSQGTEERRTKWIGRGQDSAENTKRERERERGCAQFQVQVGDREPKHRTTEPSVGTRSEIWYMWLQNWAHKFKTSRERGRNKNVNTKRGAECMECCILMETEAHESQRTRIRGVELGENISNATPSSEGAFQSRWVDSKGLTSWRSPK